MESFQCHMSGRFSDSLNDQGTGSLVWVLLQSILKYSIQAELFRYVLCSLDQQGGTYPRQRLRQGSTLEQPGNGVKDCGSGHTSGANGTSVNISSPKHWFGVTGGCGCSDDEEEGVSEEPIKAAFEENILPEAVAAGTGLRTSQRRFRIEHQHVLFVLWQTQLDWWQLPRNLDWFHVPTPSATSPNNE